MFELGARYWHPDLDAKAKYAGHSTGTRFDIEKDLDVGDEPIWDWRVLKWAISSEHWARIDVSSTGFSGDTVLRRPHTIAGQNFAAGTAVHTDIDIDQTRVGWAWQFLRSDSGHIRFGTLAEARRIQVDSTFVSAAARVPWSFKNYIPTLGFVFDYEPHERVDIYSEVTGIASYEDGHFVDAEAGVRIRLGENLSLATGYRMIDIDISKSNDSFDMRLHGPFLGARVRF